MANTKPEYNPFRFISKIFNPLTITVIVTGGLIAAVWSFLDAVMPYPTTLCIYLTVGIVISSLSTVTAVLTGDGECHVFHVFTACVIAIGLLTASCGDYKTEVVKYKPTYIFRTDSKVLVNFGDVEYSSTEIKTYNMKDSDIQICKRMAWDAWGDRNYDVIFVCDVEWREVPKNINN